MPGRAITREKLEAKTFAHDKMVAANEAAEAARLDEMEQERSNSRKAHVALEARLEDAEARARDALAQATANAEAKTAAARQEATEECRRLEMQAREAREAAKEFEERWHRECARLCESQEELAHTRDELKRERKREAEKPSSAGRSVDEAVATVVEKEEQIIELREALRETQVRCCANDTGARSHPASPSPDLLHIASPHTASPRSPPAPPPTSPPPTHPLATHPFATHIPSPHIPSPRIPSRSPQVLSPPARSYARKPCMSLPGTLSALPLDLPSPPSPYPLRPPPTPSGGALESDVGGE